jgi:MoxR-like ATPase
MTEENIPNPESQEEAIPDANPTESSVAAETNDSQVLPVMQAAEAIRREVGQVLIGQDDLILHLITGLLAGGHILIEGVPGIAKTLSAKVLARTLSLGYSRIQFTPDLMPSDVTGSTVFNLKTSEFTFNQGPVFSNVVLIDEINRAPAKTQAALFEVMEEGQITVDGITYKMDQPFIVLATQNPIEQEGTYRLPEAQLDRFLFRIRIQYPELEQEIAILERFRNQSWQGLIDAVQAVLNADEILKLRDIIEQVYIKDELLTYIAKVVNQTRVDADLFLGASPRASIALMRSAKALAAINGRAFVTPDDVKSMAIPVLNHRIQINPEREMEGLESTEVIRRILESIEIPR